MKNFNQKKLEKVLKELEKEIHEVETLIKTAKSGGGERRMRLRAVVLPPAALKILRRLQAACRAPPGSHALAGDSAAAMLGQGHGQVRLGVG